MKNVLVSLLAVAGMAAAASAQVEAGTTSLRFEVWNGSAWTTSVNAAPGSRVEYRAVVSYTGSSASPIALGSLRFQPTFSNADNTGTGAGLDNNEALRNNGNQGSAIAGSMLTAAEGADGAALASYGKVTYGGTANTNNPLSTSSRLIQFRHGGGAPVNGAPAGSWLRIAGETVTSWPSATISGTATATQLNNIARGVISSQQSRVNPVTGLVNSFYAAGTQNLIVFRGAITLSDNTDEREMVISSAAGSQDRVGGAGADADTRFANWLTSDFGGTFRSGVVISNATIVIPTPGALALVGLGGLVAARRRRA